MRKIPLNKGGKIFLTLLIVTIMLSATAMSMFLAWWTGLALLLVFIGFLLFIYVGICKYIDKSDEYMQKEIERIKSLNNGHEPILVSDEALRKMDKVGGVILEDGTPVSKEELKFV